MELTPQQVLDLARKWQFDPVAEKQNLDKEKEKIPVLRDDELAKIQEITKLNVSQTDFNHAFGWIVAEGKILDFIEEEFQSQQNPELLEQLVKEKDLADQKKTVWEKHHQKNQERFSDKTNEEEIKTLTDQNFKDELTPSPEQLTGGKREIPNVSSPASQPPSPTRVPTKVQVGVSDANNWRANFMHPEQYFGKVFSSFKNSLARVFGKKEVVGAVAKKAVVGTAAKTGLGALVKKGAASLAAKIGLGAATGGVGTAILLATEKFWNKIPPEWKNKLKDLWSMMQIGMAGLAVWLLMNLGALAGGIIGGIIGASAGALIAPFLGPLAPLAPIIGSSLGFTVGAFVGYSLQGIASSILGLGGGSAAGGVAPAVSGISFAGFTLPAGFSAAASSFGALLSGSGLSTIALFGVGGGISLISIFTALTIITVGATQQPQTQETTGKKVVFQVKNEVNPVSISTYNGEEITLNYTITITVPANQATINSVVNKVTRYSGTGTKEVYVKTENLVTNNVDKDHPLVISDSFVIKGNDYKNSQLVSVVTVTGEETETAVATVVLGQPPLAEQPFGYPAAGIIKSLDDQPWHEAIVNGLSTQLAHCGTFLPFIDPNATKRPCIAGGLDIAGEGSVFSTLEGTVVYSAFDRGPKTSACDPATSVTGFCYPGLGGVVYIQSKTGKFYVGFLHLAQDGRIASGSVKPGDLIGKIYSGPICGGSPSGDSCTSSGSHVHYQVLIKNGSGYVNYNFADHFGSCLTGNLLPLPGVTADGNKSVSSGPFVCQ